MDGVRHKLLPRSGFSQYQDAEVGSGYPAYIGDQLLHDTAGTHGLPERRLVFDLAGETSQLALESAFVQRAEDHAQHLVVFERFRQVIVSACPHRCHRIPDFRIARDQNDGEVLVQGFCPFHDLHAVHIGQLHVHDQSIGMFGADLFQGGLPAVGHHRGYHLLVEERGEQGDLLIPVHNKNLTASGCHCSFSPRPEGW